MLVRAGVQRGTAVRAAAAAVTTLAVAVALNVLQQVRRPYLSHDDWDYTIPLGTPGMTTPWSRNEFEGRWANWAWWWALGQHLSPAVASVVFVVATAIAIVWIAVRFGRGVVACCLVAAALTAAPMLAHLLFWPGVLGPSMVLLALGVLTLPLAERSLVRLCLWLFVVTVLGVLTYPPVALVLFVVLVAAQAGRSWRDHTILTVVLGLGWVAGNLASFAANLAAFGVFGVRVQPWRGGRSLHGLDDLWVNLGTYGDQWREIWFRLAPAVVVGALLVGLGLAWRSSRRDVVRIVVATAVAGGVQLGTTLLSGVITPFRSELWLWVGVVLVGARVARDARRWWVVAPLGALATLTVFGGVYAHTWIGLYRARYDVDRVVVGQVVAAARQHPDRPVILVQSPQDLASPVLRNQARALFYLIREEGVEPRYCSTDCERRDRRLGDDDVAVTDSAILYRTSSLPSLYWQPTRAGWPLVR